MMPPAYSGALIERMTRDAIRSYRLALSAIDPQPTTDVVHRSNFRRFLDP
jgi:hypothetical protein